MTDLALLRDLIGDTSARGHRENVVTLFRKLRLDSLFECVIARGVRHILQWLSRFPWIY